jgi:hypothetical protein
MLSPDLGTISAQIEGDRCTLAVGQQTVRLTRQQTADLVALLGYPAGESGQIVEQIAEGSVVRTLVVERDDAGGTVVGVLLDEEWTVGRVPARVLLAALGVGEQGPWSR